MGKGVGAGGGEGEEVYVDDGRERSEGGAGAGRGRREEEEGRGPGRWVGRMRGEGARAPAVAGVVSIVRRRMRGQAQLSEALLGEEVRGRDARGSGAGGGEGLVGEEVGVGVGKTFFVRVRWCCVVRLGELDRSAPFSSSLLVFNLVFDRYFYY